MTSPTERREHLKTVFDEARVCVRCPLHQTRTQVVFGSGNANAELMFVGEAPGANEDKQGLPFVGQAGKLLDKLLAEIGLGRRDVFVANVLKCLGYHTPVQLADGSWERVGRLVRSRYDGEVMSVHESGALVPKRVIGWHASPVAGRRVFRLSYASAERSGSGGLGIELTGDHPVLTERGYVQAQALQPTDRIAIGQGLSQLAWDLVCATVLGDRDLQGRSPYLSMSHAGRQAEYARFKAELLSAELQSRVWEEKVAAAAGGEQAYPVVRVCTPASPALRVLRQEFYRPRKLVPAWLADELNPRMLAFWFMDDGCTRIRGAGGEPLAEIATHGLSDDDLQILIGGLQRLGLPAKACSGRLYFDGPTTARLSELIAPYAPPVMRYKLVPDVQARVPFDPSLLLAGPTTVLFDDVEVQAIAAGPRPDVTFFCIDVEDTHNFVTAGGVVHNCRPPGNRDPQPNEIAACQGYLRSQVELIQPTLICTLGNFSTKLLRADTTGISRLHGQDQVLTIGARAVRLYPLYHPAAALYTAATLEALRTDFHRIPALLALGAPAQPEPARELPEPARELPEPARELPEPAEELSAAGAEWRESMPDRPQIGPGQPGSGSGEARQPGAADQLGLF